MLVLIIDGVLREHVILPTTRDYTPPQCTIVPVTTVCGLVHTLHGWKHTSPRFNSQQFEDLPRENMRIKCPNNITVVINQQIL